VGNTPCQTNDRESVVKKGNNENYGELGGKLRKDKAGEERQGERRTIHKEKMKGGGQKNWDKGREGRNLRKNKTN